MTNRFSQLNCIFHFIGSLLQILGLVLLVPLIFVFLCWASRGEGTVTAAAFIVPAAVSFLLGLLMRKVFKPQKLDVSGSMIMCAVGWLLVSGVGALPFVIATDANYLDAYFESISGFTTAGITVFSGLDAMAKSILFWRSLTQWLGGLGILSFFLMIVFSGGGVHHIFGAESHKISTGRPAPGLFNTLRILWGIYLLFTVLAVVILSVEKMPVFDAICHSLTALSTGGFSPHDGSIAFYRLTNHPNYRLIEYTLVFLMMLGGINFLVHFRVLRGDFRALWDHTEIRYWWRLLTIFTAIIIIERLYKTGFLGDLCSGRAAVGVAELESVFRNAVFQVVSILTTTGFGTKDIGSDFFGFAARQLFLVMMFIGGCAGSTSGGFKVLRVAVLSRLVVREIFKLRVSKRASSALVIDKKPVPDDEIHRIAALFFIWVGLFIIGGVITALFTKHGALESLSGMFSALGNIGPCYISPEDMINIHPAVKITYIFGMLAGRLEILPVLLMFSPRAWR